MADEFMGLDDDLMYNTQTRVPVCLCVDISNSMLVITDFTGAVKTDRTQMVEGSVSTIWEGGVCRLDELNDGIASFYKIVQADPVARDAVELSIVGFKEDAVVIQDFQNIDEAEPSLIGYDLLGDATDMDAGVNKALDLLEQRKLKYKENGRDYYQPWLIIMSDGDVDASCISSQTRAKALEAQNKLVVFNFIVGNSDEKAGQVLQGYSNINPPKKIKKGAIDMLFKWIGRSVVRASQSEVGGKPEFTADELQSIFDIDL